MDKRTETAKWTARHFMLIEDTEVEIDPGETDLPDRCKLAIFEMVTGQLHEYKGA